MVVAYTAPIAMVQGDFSETIYCSVEQVVSVYRLTSGR